MMVQKSWLGLFCWSPSAELDAVKGPVQLSFYTQAHTFTCIKTTYVFFFFQQPLEQKRRIQVVCWFFLKKPFSEDALKNLKRNMVERNIHKQSFMLERSSDFYLLERIFLHFMARQKRNFLAPGSLHVTYACLELFHCTLGTHYILRAVIIHLGLS